ncbi:MAG: hypothetical protein GF421_02460 [Candidatus Aminicenantes bacterium]|nr:hypothetical protein [Candidatus Aminicenantes bacterium]
MKKISLILFIILICNISCELFDFMNKSANCVLVGDITVQEDFEGDIKFLGEIKNDGDAKALFVKITFTMKDSGGSVIDTDFTYVNSTDLDPGQTSSFECWTNASYSQVDSYDYEITWDEESMTSLE